MAAYVLSASQQQAGGGAAAPGASQQQLAAPAAMGAGMMQVRETLTPPPSTHACTGAFFAPYFIKSPDVSVESTERKCEAEPSLGKARRRHKTAAARRAFRVASFQSR